MACMNYSMFTLLSSWQKKLFVDRIMAAMSMMIDDIPSLIPIRINFDMPRSHGMDTMNYPTLVILSILPSYFLPELIFLFYSAIFYLPVY